MKKMEKWKTEKIEKTKKKHFLKKMFENMGNGKKTEKTEGDPSLLSAISGVMENICIHVQKCFFGLK